MSGVGLSDFGVGMLGVERRNRAVHNRAVHNRAVEGEPEAPGSAFDICVLASVQCLGFILSAVLAYIIYDASLGGDAVPEAEFARIDRPMSTAEIRPETVTPPDTEIRVAKRWSVSPDKSNRLDLSNQPMDELAGDALAVAFEMVEPDTQSVAEPVRPAAPPLTGRPLGRFFSALASLEAGLRTEPITIVHLGDSHVASDSLTRGIRRRLQARFGDAGRGMMVPAGAYKYAIADGVNFKRVGHWSAHNSFRQKRGPYALSGVRLATSARGAKLVLTTQNEPFDWGEVTVVTGPKQGLVKLSAGSKNVEFNARAAAPGSKVVRIDAKGSTLTVTAAGSGATTVLNWSIGRDAPGIRYVNFGLAGATADVTKRWSRQLVANDIAHLKPDLIVWGYGTNEGFNDGLDLKSYGKTVKSFIAYLREQAPGADLLFVGPADSARLPRYAKHLRRSASCRHLTPAEAAGYGKLVSRRSSALRRWHAPPKLAAVRRFLKDLAAEQHAGYWDWSAAMGGDCSINRWASQKLAAGDRVHLTNRGYDRSAGLFVDHLINSFSQSRLLAATQQ